MNKSLIVLAIQIVVLVGAWLWGRYISPKISTETINDVTAKVELIIKYADKFVSWANYFMKTATGSERMTEVVKQLTLIANRYNLDISEAEITAIAQKAYDSMKAGEKAAEVEQTKADAAKLTAENSVLMPVAYTTGSTQSGFEDSTMLLTNDETK